MPIENPKIDIEEKKGMVSVGLPPDPNEWLRDRYDFQTKIIIGIFAVALLTMIFMAATMLLDAWHFNSAVYKEYSEKTDTLETIQKSNQLLFDSNKQNQEIIIKQQAQIEKLLENVNKKLGP